MHGFPYGSVHTFLIIADYFPRSHRIILTSPLFVKIPRTEVRFF